MNNVQEAYFPKMSIAGQIVSEIVAQLCLENSIQTLLISFRSTQKNLEGFVWSFLIITGLRSQRQFVPECSLSSDYKIASKAMHQGLKLGCLNRQ